MVERWWTTRFEALVGACGLGYMAFPVGRLFWVLKSVKVTFNHAKKSRFFLRIWEVGRWTYRDRFLTPNAMRQLLGTLP